MQYQPNVDIPYMEFYETARNPEKCDLEDSENVSGWCFLPEIKWTFETSGL